jgi:hypothetical protein
MWPARGDHADRFHPAKDLLDQFAALLAHRVSRMPGAAVDSTAHGAKNGRKATGVREESRRRAGRRNGCRPARRSSLRHDRGDNVDRSADSLAYHATDRLRIRCSHRARPPRLAQRGSRSIGQNALHHEDQIRGTYIPASSGRALGFFKSMTCRTDAWSTSLPVSRRTQGK